jgi:hypothetical protein
MIAPIRAFVDMIINMIVGWYLWPGRLTVRLRGRGHSTASNADAFML